MNAKTGAAGVRSADGSQRIALVLVVAVADNGVMSFCKMVLFALSSNGLTIEREEKFGGNVTFKDYVAMEAAYVAGTLFPLDLKSVRTHAAALRRYRVIAALTTVLCCVCLAARRVLRS